MEKSFVKIIEGYKLFRKKFALGDHSIMQYLSIYGQNPEVMVVSCCDSRVDPALLFQCDPGDLFVVRNVANIIPPYEKDGFHHGTSAALEFGIQYLQVKHLILLGHSQCGGIKALLEMSEERNDFIMPWVSIIKTAEFSQKDPDCCAKLGLMESYKNCFTFPWIKEKVEKKQLMVHLWFFDIKSGEIFIYNHEKKSYQPLL